MEAGADGQIASEEAPRTVLAGRYELYEVLGRGGSGVVWRARDLFAGVDVAVKTMRPGYLNSEPRVRREIAALRLLRIPGVVTLRDEVEADETVHLVMDLIEGTSFPGEGVDGAWEQAAPRVRSLLETLGRVHAAGVVHRDLKPSNVLVESDGRVVVLDFGLSYGPALGGTLTVAGAVVGTPEYLAPEQIRGQGIDGRTDLYALGVMLYETFAGRLPIEASDFASLMQRKLSGSTEPLLRVAPAIPRRVAETVDRLLAPDPNDRPQSAAETLRRMFGGATTGAGDMPLPRLGDPRPLEQALTATRAGTSIDVFGPLGSGRTRLLEEVAEALRAEGRDVHWITAGRSPYSSLTDVLGGFDDLAALSSEEAFAALDERLRVAMTDGTVLLHDDPDDVDPWSSRSLAAHRSAGSVVRAVSAPTEGCVTLVSLRPADLEPLFHGPSRILHLPEDAAEELWRRTGGQPGRVRAELAAWVRHGMARWEGSRVAIDRSALARLHGGLPVGGGLLTGARAAALHSPELETLLAWIALAWPHSQFDLLVRVAERPRWMLEPEVELLVSDGLVQRLDDGRLQPLVIPEALQVWPEDRRRAAHRVLADALPHGAPERLQHLAAAGEPAEVIAEAIVLGRELVNQGQIEPALAALSQALDSARREDDATSYGQVLHEYARACLSAGTPAAVNEALYELGRAPEACTGLAHLREFLLAALETQQGDPDRALTMLDACSPFDDEDLELWRHSQRARASERLPIERQATVIDEIGAWAEESGNSRARSNHRTWSASLRQRQQRFAEAAELHLEGAGEDVAAPARMAGLLNAGAAFLEVGRLTESLAAARSGVELAKSCRHPLYEAYAESLVRDIRYRLAESDEPDHELLAAVAAIGAPALEAVVAMTEAAFAWRSGEPQTARELATRSAAIWSATGYRGPYLIARGLEVDCGDPLGDGEAAALIEEAKAEDDPFAAVQLLGLLAPHVGPLREPLRAALTHVAAAIPEDAHDDRREVISVREALAR